MMTSTILISIRVNAAVRGLPPGAPAACVKYNLVIMATESNTTAPTVAAVASAVAAAASAVAAFRSAKVTERMLQVQIEPSISVDFDNSLGSGHDERQAVVTNKSGCDVTDLVIGVFIPGDFRESSSENEAPIMKCVANHELIHRTRNTLWRRKWTAGMAAKIDCAPWFTHAREILALPALTEKEKAVRSTVALEISCRRVADKRKFDFVYVYRVMLTDDWRYFVIPIQGANPADAGKRIIVGPTGPPASKAASR